MRIDRALRVIPFNPPSDCGHRLNGFHRKITHSCLVGQHHCIGAVEDGIGHIADFSPGRTRARGHRIQHLRGGDDRNSKAVGLVNQVLLKQRNLLSRHFHAQIAPGHHHAVTQGENRVDLIDRLELLDLCDYRR